MPVIDDSIDLSAMKPDKQVDIKKTFGIEMDGKAPAFKEKTAYVPDLDPAYKFDCRRRWRSSPGSRTIAG